MVGEWPAQQSLMTTQDMSPGTSPLPPVPSGQPPALYSAGAVLLPEHMATTWRARGQSPRCLSTPNPNPMASVRVCSGHWSVAPSVPSLQICRKSEGFPTNVWLAWTPGKAAPAEG